MPDPIAQEGRVMDDERDAVIGDDVQRQGVMPENPLDIFPDLRCIPRSGVDKAVIGVYGGK